MATLKEANLYASIAPKTNQMFRISTDLDFHNLSMTSSRKQKLKAAENASLYLIL